MIRASAMEPLKRVGQPLRAVFIHTTSTVVSTSNGLMMTFPIDVASFAEETRSAQLDIPRNASFREQHSTNSSPRASRDKG